MNVSETSTMPKEDPTWPALVAFISFTLRTYIRATNDPDHGIPY